MCLINVPTTLFVSEKIIFDLKKSEDGIRCMKVLMSQFFFRNGTETVSIMFSKPEKRTNWEESFNEAKQKLGKHNE